MCIKPSSSQTYRFHCKVSFVTRSAYPLFRNLKNGQQPSQTSNVLGIPHWYNIVSRR